jgi:hypothetical protein
MAPGLPSLRDVGYGSRGSFGLRMRRSLPILLIAALLAACSAGGGASSTGGGSGTLCSPCSQDSNCIVGGSCVFETAGATQGYCAVPCTVSSTCPESDVSCLDLSGGKGLFYCYPTAETCVGYVPGGSTGTSGAAATTMSASSSSDSTGSCGTDTYANFGATFMTTYCLPCHAPNNPAYFPPDCTNQATIQGDLTRVASSITDGLMPLWPDAGAPADSTVLIAPSDLTRVEAWLACGAP